MDIFSDVFETSIIIIIDKNIKTCHFVYYQYIDTVNKAASLYTTIQFTTAYSGLNPDTSLSKKTEVS